MKLRTWQKEALAACAKVNPALIEGTPGSGKTHLAACDLKKRFDSGEINGLVFVVPTRPLKKSVQKALNEAGLSIKDQQKDGRGFPIQYHGIAVCYAQLPNLVSTFEAWVRTGRRLAFVFDEVHHASERNTWGEAVADCARLATRILAMTGTPFRGDGDRIAFVDYDESGVCIPTYRYNYARAVADGVCRPVEFRTDDGVADFVLHEIESVRISETPDHLIGPVGATVFSKNAEFLEKVIVNANEKLSELRTDDEDAGGLIVCRPGTDEKDNRHIDEVSKLVEQLTGERPVVVKHDDDDSAAKISAFRKSKDRWMLSVRMVSEGIDIKRLRVCVMATHPTTELLFRQIVGRVVRVEKGCENHRAHVFMAKFPQLVGFAERIEREAEVGLLEKRKRQSLEGEEPGGRKPSMFMPIGATYENGGAMAMGVAFSANEIAAAEAERNADDLLRGVSVVAIAQLRRRHQVDTPPMASVPEPQQVVRKRLREELNCVCRTFAAQSDTPYAKAYSAVFEFVGVNDLDDLCDNQPIEKLRSAIDFAASLRTQEVSK